MDMRDVAITEDKLDGMSHEQLKSKLTTPCCDKIFPIPPNQHIRILSHIIRKCSGNAFRMVCRDLRKSIPSFQYEDEDVSNTFRTTAVCKLVIKVKLRAKWAIEGCR